MIFLKIFHVQYFFYVIIYVYVYVCKTEFTKQDLINCLKRNRSKLKIQNFFANNSICFFSLIFGNKSFVIFEPSDLFMFDFCCIKRLNDVTPPHKKKQSFMVESYLNTEIAYKILKKFEYILFFLALLFRVNSVVFQEDKNLSIKSEVNYFSD